MTSFALSSPQHKTKSQNFRHTSSEKNFENCSNDKYGCGSECRFGTQRME